MHNKELGCGEKLTLSVEIEIEYYIETYVKESFINSHYDPV